MIKSEKELYKDVFDTVSQRFSADRFVWGEDLIDKKMMIYPKKLKDISEYQSIKEQLEPCGIVLVDPRKKEFLRCISATINTDINCVYLTEAVFNGIWKSLRDSIERGIRYAKENSIETIKCPEDILDFKCLVRSGSVPTLKNYVITYQAKPLTEDERHRTSRKQSLLDNVRMLYFYAEDGRFFHDKECEEIKRISPEKFCASEDIPNKEICPHCRRKIYFRKACYPNTKQMPVCDKIFREQRVSNGRLNHFIMDEGFKFHATDFDELQVDGKEDRWIVKGLRSDKLELWHNNYVKTSPTERYITEGFHNQKVDAVTLGQMLRYIEEYSFDKHLEHEKAEKAILEQTLEAIPVESSLEAVGSENTEKESKPWYKRIWNAIRNLFLQETE